MSSERFKTQELIQETLRILKSEELPGLIAAFSYLPFFGWLFLWIFRKTQKFAYFHILQSLKLNCAFIVIYSLVWFLREFPVISWILSLIRINPIVTDFISYVSWIAFLCYSLLGAWNAYQEKESTLPFFPEMENELQKIFKKIRTGSP
ncbi:Tic20-like protein [Leptospira noguchii str. 1993005606]|uniref:Tic20-like protein n=1 Tax=Leptospira noguchii str. 2007001578 TaxID=1049974 RepID=A0ABN0J4P5_9LEPT|nr:Tic20-like protein [Leptospira noguchii]EMN01962.1 Tic20-like protein [Leptospira noguchii str. 2007001578]EPE85548.1 Tic20-like protein [Leptospira noguchii str. 1993005606]